MDRYELLRQTVGQLNELSHSTSRQQRSEHKRNPQNRTELFSFAQYLEKCLDGADIKGHGPRERRDHACQQLRSLTGKVAGLLSDTAEEVLVNYIKQLRQCMMILMESYQSDKQSNPLNIMLNKAKLENLRLEKSMKTLVRQCKEPKIVVELISTYVQTDMPYRRNYGDKSAVVFNTTTIGLHRQTKEKQSEAELLQVFRWKFQTLGMQVEDLLIQHADIHSKLADCRKKLEQADVQSSIIAFRKQLKSNTVQYFLPKLKRNSRESGMLNNEQQSFEFESLTKQKNLVSFLDVCYHHDVPNLLKSVTLEEHPFRLLRTIRTIMDSLTSDFLQLKTPCFFEFGLYLQQWFANFEMQYTLNKRSNDVQLDKIKFVLALQDYHLSKLWDVVLFRQLMCNLYEFDEVDFIIKMRWALLKRQQVDYSCGSEIVSLINIESCKQAITCAFENYPPTVTKMVLEKLSKTQIKIRSDYKIDSAYALRLMVDLYKELKAEKLAAFTAKPLGELSLPRFSELLRGHFSDLRDHEIDRIYFECTSSRLTKPREIWQYCVEHGYFNGKMVPLAEEQPHLIANDSMKECIKEYDKLTPLISSFKKSLTVRGSTNFIEREQLLELNSKLWGSEVPKVLDYFSRLQSLIRDSLLLTLRQTLHTHQRDPQLEYSLLSGLLRSISGKLTLWKKLNSKSQLYNEYVVSCTKRLQKMVRTCLPHCQTHHAMRIQLESTN